MEKLKKELKKILDQKSLNILIAICLIMGFALIALNVLLPSDKNSEINMYSGSYNNNQNQNEEVSTDDQEDYEENQKNDLKNILKKIDGVGDVDIMITFESGEQKVPAYDKSTQISKTEENDTSGGTRVNNQNTDGSKVVMTTQDGDNEPFILTTYKPKAIGVIVVAEGAENSKTKYDIEQAVSKIYDLSLDKVNVYSMKK